MSAWSHGYNVSVGYTYGYFRELAPDWLDYGLALSNHQPPAGQGRRYLELGCGQGLNLFLHAAAFPEIDFLGIDFNPLHIAHGRALAQRAGLGNLRFEEADFLALAERWPADHGQFDYVVLHGIYSWIAPELRRAIVACLGHAVRPGGVVYNSYNAQPGWTAAAPLQYLLRRIERSGGKPPAAAIDHGLALMNRLNQAGAQLFKALPQLAARIDSVASHDRAYVIQEYLHDSWHPMWHGQVAAELAGAKLRHVGTATLPEAWLPQLLPEALRAIAGETDDPALRQELIDAAINQSFRRDLYQRGATPAWPVPHAAWWKNLRLLSLKEPADGAYAFKTAFGEVDGQPETYHPLMGALRNGPRTLAELHALPAFAGQPLSRLIQAASFLLHAGHVALHRAGADLKAVRRINQAIARAVAEGAPYNYLVAAQCGQAMAAGVVDLLLLDTLAEGGAPKAPALATGLLQRLAAQGRSLRKDGAALAEPDAARQEAQTLAEQFLATRLPEWQRLGVWA